MKVCKQNDIDCIISEIDKEKENTILEKVGEKEKKKIYRQELYLETKCSACV